MPVIQSRTLRGFPELVRSLGGDPVGLARAAGLPPEALEGQDTMVSLEARATAMELAAARLDCPDFGLRMSQYSDIEGLGPLAVALRHSPTLQDAFECARRFLSLNNQGSTLALAADPYDVGGVIGVRHVWHYSGSRFPQATDAALMGMHGVIAALAGNTYTPRSVELAYRPSAPVAAYERAFGGVRVNVDRPQTMLRLPKALLGRPIEDANGTLRDVALLWLAQQRAPDDLTVTLQVRAVLESLLGTGRLTAEAVAVELEVPLRTLQRSLADEGTSIAALTEETRRERALTLLADPSISMSYIAVMLDLGHQTTFVRSARRWWAMTPRAKRQEIARSVAPVRSGARS